MLGMIAGGFFWMLGWIAILATLVARTLYEGWQEAKELEAEEGREWD